jgi:AraC family transcriptional regulator
VHFIDENLRNELTLAAIAEAVALSPGHFAHAFRQATGVAPHRYVLERQRRAGEDAAAHLLFHRITGLTPRQFRTLD